MLFGEPVQSQKIQQPDTCRLIPALAGESRTELTIRSETFHY